MRRKQEAAAKEERAVKFRNPWSDPRVTKVRPEDVQANLTRHGWKSVGPAADQHLIRFERVEGAEDAPALFVPAEVRPGSLLERMIECVADLARYEGRWAVDVLSDIRRQQAGAVVATNGPAVPSQRQPATR
jgi:hypothetical protein